LTKLQELAREPEIDDSVRLGDIFAVLIVHNAKKSNFKKVYNEIVYVLNVNFHKFLFLLLGYYRKTCLKVKFTVTYHFRLFITWKS